MTDRRNAVPMSVLPPQPPLHRTFMIPEGCKSLPWLNTEMLIDPPPPCKKQRKCGCKLLLLLQKDDVQRIRHDYLMSIINDLQKGASRIIVDGNTDGLTRTAGYKHLSKFVTPIETKRTSSNPKTKHRQQYKYHVTVNGETFSGLCPDTFSNVFGLSLKTLKKFQGYLIGRNTVSSVETALRTLVPKYTNSIVAASSDKNVVYHITHVKNVHQAWIDLLEILDRPNDKNDNSTTSSPPPSVPYTTVRLFLEKEIERYKIIAPVPRRLDDTPVTLFVTGNGIYQKGVNFQTTQDIENTYGRCKQCKLIRSFFLNTIFELTFNILTPNEFNDIYQNMKCVYGRLIDVDDDPNFDIDQLKKRGEICFNWLKERLKGRTLKEIIFIGIGFKVNGKALRELLQYSVGKFGNDLKITVVEIDEKKKNGHLKYIRGKLSKYKHYNVPINFVQSDAKDYLEKYFLDKTGFSRDKYNDFLSKMSMPTTTDLNEMFAEKKKKQSDDDCDGDDDDQFVMQRWKPQHDAWVRTLFDEIQNQNGFNPPPLDEQRVIRASTKQQRTTGVPPKKKSKNN